MITPAPAEQVHNPYGEVYLEYSKKHPFFFAEGREELTTKYAWAVPNAEALLAIRDLKMPICEIGAGRGYWGMCLRALGVECHLYDWAPVGSGNRNRYIDLDSEPWTEVLEGGYSRIENHPDAALFLCWPPYNRPMARLALESYIGSTVVYVGEGKGGCTGDDSFHDVLERDFKELTFIEILQFYGLNDYMAIYQRKESC